MPDSAPPATPSSPLWTARRRRWLRRAAWAIAALLMLWALGWLAVPPLLRSQGERIGSRELGRAVTIGAVDFRPWSLELTLRDVAIAAAGGEGGATAPQVEVERIYIDAELQSLVRLAPVIDAITVDRPVVRVTQTAPGHFDVDDILAKLRAKPPSPDGPPPRFALYNIAVHGGQIDVDDRTVGKVHRWRDVELGVPFVSSLASQREVTVRPRLAFALNGTAFDSAAEATPFADSRRADATLRLAGLDLSPFLGYLPADLPVKVTSGRLDADLSVAFEQATDGPRLAVSGTAALHELRVAQATDGAPLLSFDRLALRIAELRPLARVLHLESVELSRPVAAVRRDAGGRLNLDMAPQRKGIPPAEKAAGRQDTPASEAYPWSVTIDRIGVRGGDVAWRDDAVPGGAQAALHDLALDAHDVVLPFARPLRFAASARVDAGARIALRGEATDRIATAAVSVQSLPLAIAAPYLAQQLTPRLDGRLDADLGIARHGDALAVQIARLQVDETRFGCGAAKAPCAAALKQLRVEDTSVDLARRRVVVGRLALAEPTIQVSRDADGRWMAERWTVRPATSGGATATVQTPAGTPWAVRLGEVAVDGGAVALRDASRGAPVAVDVSALQLRLRDWSPLGAAAGAQPSPLSVSARIADAGRGRVEPGRLAFDGTLALDPLAAQGRVAAERLPVQAFEPYFGDALNVQIRRAEAGFKGTVRYAATSAGPQVDAAGDATLDEVRVRSAPTAEAAQATGTAVAQAESGRGEELLQWKSLGLRGLRLALAPGQATQVEVQETALSDFFARLVVQENGRINLQNLVKSAVQPPAGQGAAPVPPPAPAAEGPAPKIRFGPVTVANGRVNFSDRFIQPNYSADLTELAGRLDAFSSESPAGQPPQMAALELRGRAEGTASLEVTGRLNPLARPLALDIVGKVRDLELPPLSPYTVKYAGHGIERGKLSVDVAYQVEPDGRLTARNRLVLNQLKFGDEVAGAPASLPVRLATALLADRNGVIDVDLPISGSLNDPQFSIGAVVFKALGNLIVRAVTAPFSLLASAIGGGGSDDGGDVVFAPGRATLDDAARAQLDKVAQALADRPAVRLTVVGVASPEAERDGWKRARLDALVQAEKRRAARTGGGQSTDAVAPFTDAEYPALLKEAYGRADIKKPRNLVGLAKDLPVQEMESLLLASIAVPDSAMRELAVARGVAVRDYLAGRQLPTSRLFLGAPRTDGAAEAGWKPHAALTLEAS